MTYIYWSLLANFGVAICEFIYRKGSFSSFWEALPYIGIPMLVTNCGLFYSFKEAPSLLLAGAVFSIINIAIRIINSYALGEPLNVYGWLGVLLLIVSTVLLKMK